MSEFGSETAKLAGHPLPARARSVLVVDLHDPAALDPAHTGGKAAALARAAARGLYVLPGVVLSVDFARSVDGGTAVEGHPAVQVAFEQAEGTRRALVARSSSVLEDTASSSMAGQFESVIGITDFDEFTAAVRRVLDSRDASGLKGTPIAVLIQPLIVPRHGGVLFGIDPVTGRTDRRVVAAVDGGPERLVSGKVDGSRYVLDAARPRRQLHPRRRARAVTRPAARTRRAVGLRGGGVRRSPGRGVGHRARRPAGAPAVASRDDRGPRRARRTALRPRAGRRDVPRAAHRTGARPLGAAATRRRRRGGRDRRRGHPSGGGAQRGGHQRRGSGRHRPPARWGDPHEADAAAAPEPASPRLAISAARGASGGSAPRCPCSPSVCSTASTTISPRCLHSTSSPAANWWRSSTEAMWCCARCTRTRS